MKKLKASVVTLLSVALLSACGNLPNPLSKSQDGSTGQTSTATDAVGAGKESDAAKAFDTGGFKTEPLKPVPDPTPETGHITESFLLAEYVPMPYEVDPVLSKGKGGRAVFGAGSLGMIASNRAVNMLKAYDDRLQSGYYNSAEAPKARAVDPAMTTFQVVLRYDSPATAQEVAQKLAEESTAPVAENELAVSYVPDSIPNMPNTYAAHYTSESTGETDYSAFTPYNEYVVYTWTSTPIGQEQWSRDYVKKSYDKQIPLLEQFPGIKTPAGYGKATKYPPHDPNNIAIIVIGFQHGNVQRSATEVEHSDALPRLQGFCSGVVVRGSLRLGNGGNLRRRQAQLGGGIQQNLNLVGRPRLWVGEHQFGRLHVAMFAGHALHYGGQHRSNRHGGGQIIAVDLEHLLRDHALGCRNETRRVGLGLVHSDVANVDLLR